MLNIKQTAKEFFTLIKLHVSHNWKIIAIIPFMAAITIPDVIELIRRQDSLTSNSTFHISIADNLIGAFIFGCITYSVLAIFNIYKRRTMVHSTLLLPTTNSLKFASEILCTAVIFPIYLFSIYAIIYQIVIAYTGVPNILVEKLMENGNVFIIPAIPYLIILSNSFMTLMKSSLNWKIAITGILMCAALFIMIIPHVESYTNETIVLVHYYHELYQSIRVCTNAVGINEALIWLIRVWVWTAPLALYTWAYYRFKERTI